MGRRGQAQAGGGRGELRHSGGKTLVTLWHQPQWSLSQASHSGLSRGRLAKREGCTQPRG